MFDSFIFWMIPLMLLGLITPEKDDEKEEESDEDTSEEKSEDKESDDSDEEDEEEEDSDSDNEEEDEKGTLDKSKNFSDIDPKKIPKELQPHYRKMQAIFTRNNQRAVAVQRKAAAFDYLLEDPDFREFLENKKAATVKSKTSKASRSNKEDDEEDDEDTPLTKADLRKFMQEFKAEGEQEGMRTKFIQEKEKFLEDNPLAKEFLPELREIILKYGMNYPEAWKWLQANDDDIAEEVKEHRRKAKGVLKPSKNSDTRGKEPTKKGKIRSWKDAVEFAERQLGMKD